MSSDNMTVNDFLRRVIMSREHHIAEIAADRFVINMHKHVR